MDGLLVIDKPAGPTSHDVVSRVRRALGIRRVGHTGTLDPAASGVLPLVLGRATRLARFLSAGDKHYEAVVRLGWSTETGDALGRIVGEPYAGAMPGPDAIERALDPFRGTFLQQPPAYSAKKIGGRRSYALARVHAGTLPDPVQVTAHAIEVAAVDRDLATLRVACSAGFYVRSLAADLGARLGTGGHLAALRRTRSAGYGLDVAVALDAVERDGVAGGGFVPLGGLLHDLSSVVLTAGGAKRAATGCHLRATDFVSGCRWSTAWVRLLDEGGTLLGIASVGRDPELLHPSIILM